MSDPVARVELKLTEWPEALWAIRRELACLLRDEAEGEPKVVADKLRAIAAEFESGTGPT